MKTRILIVDDDSQVLDVIEAQLEECRDYVISRALTGHEALDKIKLENPDVLILDVCLPELSGIDLLTQISKESPKLIVVAITGFNHVEAKSIYHHEQVHAFLRKPLIRDDILATVKTLLQRKQGKSSQLIFTRRELEIIGLIQKGHTSKEIASICSISQRTVEKHRENMMSKTGAKNIAELVSLAQTSLSTLSHRTR